MDNTHTIMHSIGSCGPTGCKRIDYLRILEQLERAQDQVKSWCNASTPITLRSMNAKIYSVQLEFSEFVNCPIVHHRDQKLPRLQIGDG